MALKLKIIPEDFMKLKSNFMKSKTFHAAKLGLWCALVKCDGLREVCFACSEKCGFVLLCEEEMHPNMMDSIIIQTIIESINYEHHHLEAMDPM